MFVGGDVAAHNHPLLFKNGITARLCCKGKFSCDKDKRLYDMPPLLIEEAIGDSYWRVPDFVPWDLLKSAVQEFIYCCILDGHNPYTFCHQGARRAASFAMIILMVITRCPGELAYNYIKSLRNVVEPNCIDVCRKFSEDREKWMHWVEDEDIVPLPCAVEPKVMLEVIRGRKTCVVRSIGMGKDAYKRWFVVGVDEAAAFSQGNPQENFLTEERFCPWTLLEPTPTQPKMMPKAKHIRSKTEPKIAQKPDRKVPESSDPDRQEDSSVWADPDRQEDSSQKASMAPPPRAVKNGEQFDGPGLRPPMMPPMMPPDMSLLHGQPEQKKTQPEQEKVTTEQEKVTTEQKKKDKWSDMVEDGQLDKSEKWRWSAYSKTYLPNREEPKGTWARQDGIWAKQDGRVKENHEMKQVDDDQHEDNDELEWFDKEEANRLAEIRNGTKELTDKELIALGLQLGIDEETWLTPGPHGHFGNEEKLARLCDETITMKEREVLKRLIETELAYPKAASSQEELSAVEPSQEQATEDEPNLEMKDMMKIVQDLMAADKIRDEILQQTIKDEVAKVLLERDSANAAPHQTTVFDQDAKEAEEFYGMLLLKDFEGAKQILEIVSFEEDSNIAKLLTHKDPAELNVAHVLAHAVEPELAVCIDERAHDYWVDLVNSQTIITRTPGGWTPLHCMADQTHKNMLASRVQEMVDCIIRACVWETMVKVNNKGNTFMHLAVQRGNIVFVQTVLPAMFAVWSEEQIKLLLNMQNHKKQSVADASVYYTEIKMVVRRFKGEHNLPPPPSWKDNTKIPQNHHWNRRCRNDGHWPECGDEGGYGHGSGCGDEGGRSHSRTWRSKSRGQRSNGYSSSRQARESRPHSRPRVYGAD